MPATIALISKSSDTIARLAAPLSQWAHRCRWRDLMARLYRQHAGLPLPYPRSAAPIECLRIRSASASTEKRDRLPDPAGDANRPRVSGPHAGGTPALPSVFVRLASWEHFD